MKKAYLVVGLGFGDEGKGSVVDALVRRHRAGLVVRFNGGSQAAHNVVSPDGVHHCFSQFGSGGLVPGTKTYLSRFMLVDPLGLEAEAEVLAKKIGDDPWERLIVNSLCPVITPYHKAMNRIRETCAGEGRNGSCGKGVGEAMKDFELLGDKTLFVGDLGDEDTVRWKLNGIRLRKLDLAEQLVGGHPTVASNMTVEESLKKLGSVEYMDALVRAYRGFAFGSGLVVDVGGEYLSDLLSETDSVFEGAQGVLLDRNYGFYPYITPTATTFDNAVNLLSEVDFKGDIERIGVVRGYATRHGPGPFPTRDESLERLIPDEHNVFGEWQRDFRIGWFDVPLASYALKVCGGVDSLAVTNIDRLEAVDEVKVAIYYEPSQDGSRFMSSKSRLKSLKNPSAVRQSEMGGFLNACHPISAVVERKVGRRNFRAYVSFLERSLGIEASILSFGHKAGDKLFL